MQTSSVRTFLCVELPAEIQSTLRDVQRSLEPHADSLKLVSPHLIHLTIRFLGNLDAGRMPLVEGAAIAAAGRVRPFQLSLGKIGAFPSLGRPRVVWTGLDAGNFDLLELLFSNLEDELSARGFERDSRGLSPHLTIARVREGTTRESVRAIGETVARLQAGPTPKSSFEVTALTVMRSDLSPKGPTYTPLAHAPLGR